MHDVSNKPYIEGKHGSEKHRYSKSDLFGFCACNGHDYRFPNWNTKSSKPKNSTFTSTTLPYRKEDRTAPCTNTTSTSEPRGMIQALTLANLKQAFPENHRFHDSLDATFGNHQNVAEYDEFHKMFKVNRLLIASREPQESRHV